MNDCCQVCIYRVSLDLRSVSCRLDLTKPTATSAEPVFHPTRENWFENQYRGLGSRRQRVVSLIQSVPARES